ncbi:MAG: alginate lyase family protein [Opitutaceae bacterium]|nr:alginate lyase family protein [Opitutaceae bacterium]
MNSERHGQFPFYRYAARHDIWDYTPMDQGGRFVQLQVIGSEKDADIVAAVTRSGFFRAWGEPVVWDSLEKTELEKSVWLNRWYYLPSFARLYFTTGDRAHVEFIVGFVRRWMNENPVPRRLPEYFASGRYNWRDMQVAWRTQNLIWCYFLGFEALGAETRREWRRAIAAHARVLLAYFGRQPLHENNHQSHGALTMLLVGVLFPDFREATELCRTARRILGHHLEHAFYADGNSVELCPGYYPFFVAIFRDAWLLCVENGLPPPARCRERLVQFHHYLRMVRQPDGTMPPINDSSESASGTSVRILGDLLGLPDPPARSHWFLHSHQAVLHDAPAPGGHGMYLFADAGPQMLWHWHGGKLGFHFWGGGRPWLVDSGVCNYDDPLRHRWFTAPESHNTLLVDGAGDYRRADLDFAAKPVAHSRVLAWKTTGTFDHVVMRHGGFAGRNGRVAWVRHIVMVKDRFVVVVDEVASASAHNYAWPLHFAPCRLEVHPRELRALARDRKNQLHLAAALAEGELTLASRRGVVSRRGKNLPAPILRLETTAARAVLACVFAPDPDAKSRPPTITVSAASRTILITVRQGKRATALRLPALVDRSRVPADGGLKCSSS